MKDQLVRFCPKCSKLMSKYQLRNFEDEDVSLWSRTKLGTTLFVCDNKECERCGVIVDRGYLEPKEKDA